MSEEKKAEAPPKTDATPAAAPAAAAAPPKPAGPPPMPKPPPLIPFVMLPERATIDHGEQAPDGSKPLANDREWIGYANQGGGKVPDDWFWGDSPKQRQDEEM
jgi:hypothetical protein